jgi:hypothetical protein
MTEPKNPDTPDAPQVRNDERAGWIKAAQWIRTEHARAMLLDMGVMSLSYADRNEIANLLERALRMPDLTDAHATPLDLVRGTVKL